MFVHYSIYFRTFGASLIAVGYSGNVLFEGKRELKSTSGLWILDLLIHNFANGSWKDGMHLSVVFNRSHCTGKDRKKNRTDSCLQQENSDSRTMSWDDCMKWNFDHQRLYKMDLLKLNVRNQFSVPCFLHFECQRNTSSTIVAYVKNTLLHDIVKNRSHHELLIHQTYKLMVQKSYSQPPFGCIPKPVF